MSRGINLLSIGVTDTHGHVTDIEPLLDNIRAQMARRRVTQREIADRIGISQPAFSARMAGKTPLDVSELFIIADLLDVDPSQLLKESA